MLVVCPRRLHPSANTLIVLEHLILLRNSVCGPEHGPVRFGNLPRPPRSLKVPLVHRIVASTSPADAFGKASANHGIKEDVGNATSTLASFQNREFVKVWYQAGIVVVG